MVFDRFGYTEKEQPREIEHFPPCDYCGSRSHFGHGCEVYKSHFDMGSLENQAEEEWVRGREIVLAKRRAAHFGGPWERFIKNPTKEQRSVLDADAAAYRKRLDDCLRIVLESAKRRKA